MTTGMLLFYGGLALLVLTIILAVVFALCPPKYIPENAAIAGPGDSQTQPLKNAYPTNRLTVRRGSASAPTEPIPASSDPQTALLNPTEDTALLDTPTELLPQSEETAGGMTELLPEESKS